MYIVIALLRNLKCLIARFSQLGKCSYSLLQIRKLISCVCLSIGRYKTTKFDINRELLAINQHAGDKSCIPFLGMVCLLFSCAADVCRFAALKVLPDSYPLRHLKIPLP